MIIGCIMGCIIPIWPTRDSHTFYRKLPIDDCKFQKKKKSIRIVSPFQKAGDFIEEDKRPQVPFVSENEDPLNLSVAEWQRSSLVLYKGY